MTSPPRLTSSPLPLQTRRFCAAREASAYKPCNVSYRQSVRPYPDLIAEVHGRTLRLRDQFLQEASRDGYYASRGETSLWVPIIFPCFTAPTYCIREYADTCKSGTSWETQKLKKVTVPLLILQTPSFDPTSKFRRLPLLLQWTHFTVPSPVLRPVKRVPEPKPKPNSSLTSVRSKPYPTVS